MSKYEGRGQGKFSTRGEYLRKLKIFASNSRFIDEHNANPSAQYTLEHNEFSTLTWEEFRAARMGLRTRDAQDAANNAMSEDYAAATRRLAADKPLPSAVDWSTHVPEVVTAVKNQGICGSCWAFSAVGALEGAYALVNPGGLVDLSEEELIDCDQTDGGCGGGEMENAFDWIKANGGVCRAEDYPYRSGWLPFRHQCKTCTPVEGTTIDHWVKVDETEDALKAAVSQQPVAIGIEADNPALQFYKGGVFTTSCGTNLDHGVLLVGYGTTEDGVDYWKVKNSWGASWGDEGYILLERGNPQEEGGQCGLLLDALVPLLHSEGTLSSSAHGDDCGGGTASFNVVDISPSAPKRGSPVTLKAAGILTKPLISGSYTLEVELSGTKVYSHEGNVCGESKASLPLGLGSIDMIGPVCPSMPGPIVYGLEVSLPLIAPPGTYKISLRGSDQDSTPLMCLEVQLSI